MVTTPGAHMAQAFRLWTCLHECFDVQINTPTQSDRASRLHLRIVEATQATQLTVNGIFGT